MTQVNRTHLAGLEIYKELHGDDIDYMLREDLNKLIDKASAEPEQEPVEIEWPEFSEQGMGCGLEDRGITDRYEAMRYGYDEALDQAAQVIEGMGPLYTHADDGELYRLRAELADAQALLRECLKESSIDFVMGTDWIGRLDAFLSATAQPAQSIGIEGIIFNAGDRYLVFGNTIRNPESPVDGEE